MRESTVHIGLLLPDIMGTYGDNGNAVILRQRLRWRGIDAEVVPVTNGQKVPSSLDIYLIGGGEDTAQLYAARELTANRAALQSAVDRGAPVFSVCAGMQILGTRFTDGDGRSVDGAQLLDLTTGPGQRRSISEVVVHPDETLLRQTLTGFENHQGVTTLGSDTRPLGRVSHGAGNGNGMDGAYRGRVIGTYLHGPALARNPELADLLLSWVVGEELKPLDSAEIDELRRDRLRSVRRTKTTSPVRRLRALLGG